MTKVTKTAKPTRKYLITYSDNWADEMDIEGFGICESDSKLNIDEYLSDFKHGFKIAGSFIYCIGTNEEIEYDSFEDFKSKFTIKEITDEQYKVLYKLNIPTGFFPEPRDEWYDDNENLLDKLEEY